jgi:hypothetical protein
LRHDPAIGRMEIPNWAPWYSNSGAQAEIPDCSQVPGVLTIAERQPGRN